MLRATATMKVNAVIWIMSLEKASERQSTEQVLTFLEPFLQAMQVPFLKVEPKTRAELFQLFKLLEDRVKTGLRPIIHLDTHGGLTDGLYVAASREFITWRELVDRLRPINIAAQNNVCVVSAACFSLHTIMNIDFRAPTPFFVMFAPQHEVSFGFIESNMFNFYESVFTSHDVMLAHERHLAPKLQQFHCHRLVLKGLSGYVRDSCIGKGRRKRVRALVKKNLGPGNQHPDTPELRRVARLTAIALTQPSQELIDRHAKPFLMGRSPSIGFDEIWAFVRADAMRRNVLVRRAARTRRQNRRVQHARRKRMRVLKRR